MTAAAAAAADFSAWELLVTSATPTLIVCLLGLVGVIMAYQGVLNEAGCQTVARICFYVFTPALTFGKLVQAVSLTSIAHLWPLLANTTISILMGLVVGMLVARLTRTPPEFRNIVICAVSIGNVGNLPLVFVSTLCHDKSAIFYRSLGEECEHRGIAYVAFNIAAATLWQFTVAINLIRRGAARAAAARGPIDWEDSNGSGSLAGAERGGAAAAELAVLPIGMPSARPLRKEPTLSDLLKGRRSRSTSAGSSPRPLLLLPGEHPLPTLQLNGQPVSPRQSQLLPSSCAAEPLKRSHHAQHAQHAQPGLELQPVAFQPVAFQPHALPEVLGWTPGQPHPMRSGSGVVDISDACGDTSALLEAPGGGKRSDEDEARAGKGGRGGGTLVRYGRAAWRYMRFVEWGAAFPLPSQAAILGVIVGCIPPLKYLLYSPHPPLRVISETLDTLGDGLIPTTIPLLGAVLYRGPGASRLPLRVVVAVVVTRLVLQAALFTGMVVAALRFKLFTSPDPMFLLTLLLSNVTPTAINMQTLTVLYRTGEGEMATLLFWQYLASVVTLPACMWVFLRIIHSTLAPI